MERAGIPGRGSAPGKAWGWERQSTDCPKQEPVEVEPRPARGRAWAAPYGRGQWSTVRESTVLKHLVSESEVRAPVWALPLIWLWRIFTSLSPFHQIQRGGMSPGCGVKGAPADSGVGMRLPVL